MKKNYGINLPITPWGLLSATEVMEKHIEKLNNANFVWLSTSNRIDKKKAEIVDNVLFSNKSGLRYLATVVDYKFFDEKGVPDTAVEFCPEFCNTTPETHWFLLDSIRIISEDELRRFSLVNKSVQEKFGSVNDYIEKTKRLQVFYFQHN